MRRIAAAALLGFAWALVAAGSAHADPGANPGAGRVRDSGFIGQDVLVLEVDDCRPRPNVTDDQLRKLASEHYQRGEVLYAQGDYPGAVTELVDAYCTYPYYAVLKDIGQAYERELEYAKAIAYLERFVRAVPPDAKRANACEPDPQDEKANVLARITVLSGLKAKIRVETDPPDARISLANAAGVAVSRAPAGGEMEVSGGTYQMTIEASGFRTKTKEVVAEIGQPYTYYERLDRVVGHVHVRVVPDDARLYLDDKPIEGSTIDTNLPGGRHKLHAEADGRFTVDRELDVVPDGDTQVSFELPSRPEYGRKQLLGYGTVAAGVASSLLAGVQTDPFYALLAFGGGVAGGFFGIYYGTPHDLALGTSSLTITGSLSGGVAGGALVAIVTDNFDPNTAGYYVGGGLAVGAAAGYYVGRKTNLTAGDAAVINSGALWGTVSGSLLSLSFNGSSQISGGIVLAGLGIGTVGGVLLQRYVTVSRPHAALIDASGVVGIVGGLATLSLFTRASGGNVNNDERTSNFALGGLAAGLIVGGVLTREMDEPKLAVTPTIGSARTGSGKVITTFGIGGAF